MAVGIETHSDGCICTFPIFLAFSISPEVRTFGKSPKFQRKREKNWPFSGKMGKIWNHEVRTWEALTRRGLTEIHFKIQQIYGSFLKRDRPSRFLRRASSRNRKWWRARDTRFKGTRYSRIVVAACSIRSLARRFLQPCPNRRGIEQD